MLLGAFALTASAGKLKGEEAKYISDLKEMQALVSTSSYAEYLAAYEDLVSSNLSVITLEGSDLVNNVSGDAFVTSSNDACNKSYTVSPEKWACEGLKITKQKKGGVLVSPNDMNIPEQMVELQIELQEMRRKDKEQSEKISELNKKIEKLLEGYDIT